MNSHISVVNSIPNPDDELLRTLLERDNQLCTVVGAVDYKRNPAVRSKTGRWCSAAFIIGVEMAERIAYFGIVSNLINFLTKELGQSTAMAAVNVNAWSGVALLLPVVGAVIADSLLGKYRTVLVASFLYILGTGLLTVSAMLPTLSCLTHYSSTKGTTGCSSKFQIILFFGGLYLAGAGKSGHKPCLQAFGADQFDGDDPVERKAKSSFFNWWNFGSWMGSLLGTAVLSYVQDNLSWSLGFGIPCIIMVVALLLFVLGTFTYRYIEISKGQSPFCSVGRVFVRAPRNSNLVLKDREEVPANQPDHRSRQFRFLDKAMLGDDISNVACSKSEVEEAKAILGLFPIWITSLAFAIVLAQAPTFFTKQGVTLVTYRVKLCYTSRIITVIYRHLYCYLHPIL